MWNGSVYNHIFLLVALTKVVWFDGNPGMTTMMGVTSCAYDGTGSLLATVDSERVLREWSCGAGEKFHVESERTTPHSDTPLAVCYAPLGACGVWTLASVGADGALVVYAAGRRPAVMRDAAAPLRAVAWSRAGLATAGDDGMCRIYRRAERRTVDAGASASGGMWRLVAALRARGGGVAWAGEARDVLLAGTNIYRQHAGACAWRLDAALSRPLPAGKCVHAVGRRVAVGMPDGVVWIGELGVERSRTLQPPFDDVDDLKQVAWDDTGECLAVVYANDKCVRWAYTPEISRSSSLSGGATVSWDWRVQADVVVPSGAEMAEG